LKFTSPRLVLALMVVGVHLAAMTLLIQRTTSRNEDLAATELPNVMTGIVIVQKTAKNAVPVPEVLLQNPRVTPPSITEVRFESSEWGDISGVVAAASAPQLSRLQPVSVDTFARRAGLKDGQAASVVLTVEILPDGTVGRVELLQGSGNPDADVAAVAYARELRWIPGTLDHRAQVMRINLPVTLVGSA
jgi:TonB family protein